MTSPRSIAIVGAGASGTLLAAALVKSSPDVSVVVFDPRPPGLGAAYSTDCPAHLLNVPASGMSAFPDRLNDFIYWLDLRYPGNYARSSFVPRRIYGEYLSTIFANARRRARGRLHHQRMAIATIDVRADAVLLTRSDGEAISADCVVLACGNGEQTRLESGLSESLRGRFFRSPWAAGALVPFARDEPVVIVGSGLTAVDAVLGLRHNGHSGKITMISRRGLLPHEHRFQQPATVAGQAGDADLIDALKRAARAGKASGDWRLALDGLRARTNDLWRTLSEGEQRRFLRHAFAYWNVHRHRMAPEAVRELTFLLATGSLRTVSGRIEGYDPSEDGILVRASMRGTHETVFLKAARVIECTGPARNLRAAENELLQALLRDGVLAPHPSGIGANTANDGSVIGSAGTASDRVFAIGPMRLGTLLETTAIPEIRSQAYELAARLLAPVRQTPHSRMRRPGLALSR